MKVYLANPLGFTVSGRYYLQQVMVPALSGFLEVIEPFVEGGKLGELSQVGHQNARLIEECDLLIAVLDGPDVDSGVAAEIGYAAGLGKICHGLREDLRVTGEGLAKVNLQVAYFIEKSGGQIFERLEDLIEELSCQVEK
ncbi:MAG: nucleoside 2-deoxyribosyltransferase [Verrucomicrobiota bacterium]|nr:nucleoside 2-deoxyribosyltransferase [Verrucomicrobiota bacterium]